MGPIESGGRTYEALEGSRGKWIYHFIAPLPRLDPRWWTPSLDGQSWGSSILGFDLALQRSPDGRTWTAKAAGLIGGRQEEKSFTSDVEAGHFLEELAIEEDGLRARESQRSASKSREEPAVDRSGEETVDIEELAPVEGEPATLAG